MKDELRSGLQTTDLVDGCLQRGRHIRVGRFVKSDVTVTDLGESEPDAIGIGKRLSQEFCGWYASIDRPKESGTGPGHTFQEAPPVDAVVVVIVRNSFRQDSSPFQAE